MWVSSNMVLQSPQERLPYWKLSLHHTISVTLIWPDSLLTYCENVLRLFGWPRLKVLACWVGNQMATLHKSWKARMDAGLDPRAGCSFQGWVLSVQLTSVRHNKWSGPYLCSFIICKILQLMLRNSRYFTTSPKALQVLVSGVEKVQGTKFLLSHYKS